MSGDKTVATICLRLKQQPFPPSPTKCRQPVIPHSLLTERQTHVAAVSAVVLMLN